jgi:hypothetical protein
MKAYIEAQGSLLSLKLTGFKPSESSGGGRRGVIRKFSRASRRRLMRFMARLQVRKIRATFLTLTFAEMLSHEQARIVFKRFSMRLRRKFEQCAAVWRLEYQPKRGAIHYHLICFNLPFWKQSEIQKEWEACTLESRSIVDIRLIHGARSIMAYVAKYVAKVDDTEIASLDDGSYQHKGGETASARFWGYINKELLPLGQKFSGVLTDRATIKSLSSFMWALIGSDNPYNSISAHLFADNARWLCERAIEEGGMWEWECEYETKDLTTLQPSRHPFTGHFSEAELSLINTEPLGRDYRPNGVSSSQPVISDWVRRSSKAVQASRVFPYFDEHGIVVTSDSYKQEFCHAAL